MRLKFKVHSSRKVENHCPESKLPHLSIVPHAGNQLFNSRFWGEGILVICKRGEEHSHGIASWGVQN